MDRPDRTTRDGVNRPDEPRPAELLELDRATCLALLTSQHIGRLVTDTPAAAIRVVNYTAFEHVIVFRSDRGPHIDALVEAPVVFEADMIDQRTRSGWSVVVRGVAHDVSDHLDGFGLAGATVEPWAPGPKNRWIGITIGEITGRLLRGEIVADSVSPEGYL